MKITLCDEVTPLVASAIHAEEILLQLDIRMMSHMWPGTHPSLNSDYVAQLS